MTEKQRIHFYMPRWNRAARANNWRMENQRLACDRAANEQRSDLHAIIWQHASLIAQASHRAIIPEDFRYAVNSHVNHGKTSSKAIKESWRVNWAVAVFDLLADPDNVAAMVRYQFPQLAERAGTLAYMLTLHPQHVWEELSLNAFGTRDWKTRSDQNLDWLIKAKKNPSLLVKKEPADEPNRLVKRTDCVGVPVSNIPF